MFKVYIRKTQKEEEAGTKRRKNNEPSEFSIDAAFFYNDVKNDLLPL